MPRAKKAAKPQPKDVTDAFISKMRGGNKPANACRWFLLCKEPAVRNVPHPVLGEVPCCEKHAQFAEGK